MHTGLWVCSRGLGCVRSVVDGLVLDGWDAAQAMHEPVGVVPVHPVGGEQFHVGQPVQRAMPERGVIADGFVLVEPDRGFGQSVIVGVADGADAENVRRAIEDRLRATFDLHHTTLQMEREDRTATEHIH